MDDYELVVTNRSSQSTTFTMYLGVPKVSVGDPIYSLAWFCQYCPVGVTIRFKWQLLYNAIWSQPGSKLGYGVVCDVSPANDTAENEQANSQVIDVDLMGENTTSLSYNKTHNIYNFGPAQKGTENTITINCDPDVPNANTTSPSSVAGVGIGLSNQGTFIVGAQPNIGPIWSDIEPNYYLVAGSFVTGEILSIESIEEHALNIPYQSVLKRSAIYNQENLLVLVD